MAEEEEGVIKRKKAIGLQSLRIHQGAKNETENFKENRGGIHHGARNKTENIKENSGCNRIQ